MAVFATAYASAADPPPPPVDAARQNERYVIEAGAESLLAEMLGRGETLPGGCTLTDGKIERTTVLATYSCGDGKSSCSCSTPRSRLPAPFAPARFAIATTSGPPPAGLVEAVAERIRAREAAFEWTDVGGARTPTRRWPVLLGGGALAAILALWALRRRASRRTRSD